MHMESLAKDVEKSIFFGIRGDRGSGKRLLGCSGWKREI
jgi:hypothetical protein